MAKKVIRLTESDLKKIVQKVILEQGKFNVRATENSSPEAQIVIENGKKVLIIQYGMGLNPDQKFIVDTKYPATNQPTKVYVKYKGGDLFHIGDKTPVPATIIGVVK